MLEKIVCTKEQAERLKDAGWTKETVFGWFPGWLGWKLIKRTAVNEGLCLPAPTIGELIEATEARSLFRWNDIGWETSGNCNTVKGRAFSTESLMESLVRLFEAQNKKEVKP